MGYYKKVSIYLVAAKSCLSNDKIASTIDNAKCYVIDFIVYVHI